jgi:cell division protein FtsA
LGGGTTDYLGYADSTIAVVGSLAIGGDHISNDIARGLRISMTNAERLKEKSGSAILSLANRTQKLELPNETGPEGRIVRLGDLHTITSYRAEEILNMVKAHIGTGDLLQRFGAGVVLTGGGANMERMAELAEKVFGMTCRIGKARDISGLATTANKPEYATVIGLLRYAARTTRRSSGTKSLVSIWKKFLTGEE